MLRIGIEVSPLTRRHYTGTEWYLWNLISELAKTPGQSNFLWDLYVPHGKVTKKLILPHNWRFKILRWPFSRFWLSSRLTIEMVFNKPGLLFVPANSLPPVGGELTVTSIHDVGFFPYPEFYSDREHSHLIRSLKRVKRIADHIIVPSQFTAVELQKYTAITQKQISVVPLGIDTEALQKLSIQHDNERDEETYILFVGRITLKKNLTTLLNALKILTISRLCNCLLIGPIGFGGKQILDFIEKEHLKERVRVMPWQEEMALRTYISNARALIVPSWYEGFGLTILEAQALSTPVVCSDILPLKETAGEGALFFPPEKPQALARTIETIISSSEVREMLQQQGLRNAAAHSSKRMAQETMNVILDVLKKGKPLQSKPFYGSVH